MKGLERGLTVWVIALAIILVPTVMQTVYAADYGSSTPSNSTMQGDATRGAVPSAPGVTEGTRTSPPAPESLTGESSGSSGTTYATPWQTEPREPRPSMERGAAPSAPSAPMERGAPSGINAFTTDAEKNAYRQGYNEGYREGYQRGQSESGAVRGTAPSAPGAPMENMK